MDQINAATYAKAVARAWKDPAFKRELLADPASVLAGMGIAVPTDKTVIVIENTDEAINLVLPAPPPQTGLSEADLERAARQAQNLLFHGGPTININE
jgi:hypothetical protein